MWQSLRLARVGAGVLLSAGLLALTARAGAGPATQNDAQPDASTPKGALYLADRTVPTGGMEMALTFYQTGADNQRELARCCALLQIASGHLEDAVVQKFGRHAADEAIHAMGLKVAADVEAATEKTEQDKSLIQWKEGGDPQHMIKVAGAWKVDVAAEIAGMDDKAVRRLGESLKHLAVGADRVADQVAGGKLASVQDVIDVCREQRQSLLNVGK